jgi:talin
MQRLQAAGHAVKTATEHLVRARAHTHAHARVQVRAAKQSIEADDERTLVISQRMVTGIAQVMDAQEAVIKKERELDAARRQLHDIRRAKYKDGEGPADFTDF